MDSVEIRCWSSAGHSRQDFGEIGGQKGQAALFDEAPSMEMIFAPGFPVGQRRELEAYCRTNKVRCSQQLAAGSELLIGSIILGIGFGAKSFLEEFLKELAKDAY